MLGPASEEGSRRERKKARTRAGIFAAARDLWAAGSFETVTVDQICRVADVARATFFQHFPTKGALLRELDRALAAEAGERLRAAGGRSLGEARALLEWLEEQGRARGDVVVALLHGATGPDPEDDRPGLHDLVEEMVRRGQERGELRRNVSAHLAAGVFLASAARLLAADVPGERATRSAERRNELLHALLHGLQEPKPRIKWSARASP